MNFCFGTIYEAIQTLLIGGKELFFRLSSIPYFFSRF